ncbi:MAG: glutamate--tRNA ligase [Candidatus Eremiobacteraeota bacterium]|nr:glutamate--tRNA ligase [Candidatus Eremiobacteraeota bacterium]
MSVRTRLAPSPTGDPHVGTAFVALINYLFAKRNGGQFILRIEDTDRARSTPESERAILEALQWLGLHWDEGPDVGGPHGPYRQSDRLSFYTRYADELLAAGHAFKCFCTADRLDAVRMEQRQLRQPPGYDGHCLTLRSTEAAELEAAGTPYVVRLKVPREGSVAVQDLLRGEIVFEWRTVDMQVLVKSDGWPTYHLANVVDDHLMGITHVMRGEEWISSAPKHALLYQYFGWKMPALAHLPLLRNPDKSKLSKRKNPTGILFYQRMGYLPEALLNFLGLLAVPPLEGEEIMDLPTMVGRFVPEHISVGGPVFDVPKLDWLNGRYLREKLDAAQFGERVRDWALNKEYLGKIAPLAQSRIERLSALGPLLAFFFAGRVDVDVAQLRAGKLDDAELKAGFTQALERFEALPEWNVAAIDGTIRAIADVMGKKVRDLVRPFYVAITGRAQSVPLYDSIVILGRDIVRERLRYALEVLGRAK